MARLLDAASEGNLEELLCFLAEGDDKDLKDEVNEHSLDLTQCFVIMV